MPQADTITCDSTPLPFYMQTEAYPTTEAAAVDVGIPLDSIFRPVESADTVYRTTLFTGHRLEPQHTTLQERPAQGMPAWVFAVIVAICALLCIYCRSHKLHIGDIIKSIFDGNATDRQSRSTVHGIACLPIVLMLAGVLGLAVWDIALAQTGVVGYLLLTLAIAVAYLLRNAVLAMLAGVYDRKQAMNSYIAGNYMYHLMLTAIVAPMLFVQAYVPGAANSATFVIGGLTILVFAIRFLKGAKLFLTIQKGFSFFLFYYLCILETMPLLVALKWFISQ